MKFKQNVREFLSSKSNWTGMGMIVTGVVSYSQELVSLVEMIQTVGGGMALIFVKDAIAGARQ